MPYSVFRFSIENTRSDWFYLNWVFFLPSIEKSDYVYVKPLFFDLYRMLAKVNLSPEGEELPPGEGKDDSSSSDSSSDNEEGEKKAKKKEKKAKKEKKEKKEQIEPAKVEGEAAVA